MSSVSLGGSYQYVPAHFLHKTYLFFETDVQTDSDIVSFSLSHCKHVLQDYMGVLVSWNLGVSPSCALQHCWPGGLLFFQHVGGDVALRSRGQAQQPCLE